MTMGEKIALLRRQRAWSQEELAEKLGVSRQSVSKWESGGSIPDLERVVRLAELFDVSTDYLIRDNVQEDEYAPALVPAEDAAREVSLDEANAYLDTAVHAGRGIALGVGCMILCPVPLFLLYGLWAWELLPGGERLVKGLGLALLFVFIAAGTALLILNGMQLSKYEYLEKERLNLAYGVHGIVNRKKSEYAQTFRLGITLGVCGILLGLIPLIVAGALEAPSGTLSLFTALFLFCVAAAVCGIVTVGIRQGSYSKLLEEGDYTPERKRAAQHGGPYYWCVVTAGYLLASFLTKRWDITWIVWPVAGVLYPAFIAIVNAAKAKN